MSGPGDGVPAGAVGGAPGGGRAGAVDAVGVVGAGTMGAGIAQLACLAGCATFVHDPLADHDEVLAKIGRDLERGAERGRWSREEADAARERLNWARTLDDLGGSDVVIEAAPESLELKQELFRDVAAVVADDCVLATNTSSIPITAIAREVPGPERVVGMHFFNPPALMRLVEVIAGAASGEDALARARALGEAMGRRVIEAVDAPGFLVNRCNRPFGLEALRLLGERVADVETIDRVVRLGGGFRMGPFELQDLVGIDTGQAVARSFHELSFGLARWRPSPLAERLVAAGWLGRKSGRGWYEYPPGRPEDPPAPALGEGASGELVVIAGDLPLVDDLLELAREAGWDARGPEEAEGEVPWLLVDCQQEPEVTLQGGPLALLCAGGGLATLDPGGAAAGFHALPPLGESGLVELTRQDSTTGVAAERTERFFASLGRQTAWVGDGPGLVLGRIVCQLVNEALFAVEEGVGAAQDVDDGMVLGLNHPRGPFAWLGAIGAEHVHAVLEALRIERGDAYLPAPALRRAALRDLVGG